MIWYKKLSISCSIAAVIGLGILLHGNTALAASSAHITGDYVNFRNGASMNSGVITMLRKNTNVAADDPVNGWCKVSYQGLSGYVSSSYVSAETAKAYNPSSSGVLLRVGSSGSEVSDLQDALREKGFYNYKTTGYFGSITLSAVREFQSSNGLECDGIVGNATRSKLYGSSNGNTNRGDANRSAAAGSSIVSFAKSFIGVPYVYGGSTPRGFDCSGFTSYVFSHFGISLPRTAQQQSQVGTAVSRSNLQPGDLIFFGSPAYHVAIYVGGNMYIHSPQTGDHVKISTLYNYTSARRVIN